MGCWDGASNRILGGQIVKRSLPGGQIILPFFQQLPITVSEVALDADTQPFKVVQNLHLCVTSRTRTETRDPLWAMRDTVKNN